MDLLQPSGKAFIYKRKGQWTCWYHAHNFQRLRKYMKSLSWLPSLSKASASQLWAICSSSNRRRYIPWLERWVDGNSRIHWGIHTFANMGSFHHGWESFLGILHSLQNDWSWRRGVHVLWQHITRATWKQCTTTWGLSTRAVPEWVFVCIIDCCPLMDSTCPRRMIIQSANIPFGNKVSLTNALIRWKNNQRIWAKLSSSAVPWRCVNLVQSVCKE